MVSAPWDIGLIKGLKSIRHYTVSVLRSASRDFIKFILPTNHSWILKFILKIGKLDPMSKPKNLVETPPPIRWCALCISALSYHFDIISNIPPYFHSFKPPPWATSAHPLPNKKNPKNILHFVIDDPFQCLFIYHYWIIPIATLLTQQNINYFIRGHTLFLC